MKKTYIAPSTNVMHMELEEMIANSTTLEVKGDFNSVGGVLSDDLGKVNSNDLWDMDDED